MIRFLLFLAVLPAAAQERTGTISGRVSDATGADLGAVSLVLQNMQTGLERGAETPSTGGDYRFPLLPPGVYRITAKRTGFQTTVREGITVGVNQPARVDFLLPVQSTEQAVTVTGDAPQVNTVNATGGVTIDGRAIVELPLNGRNFVQLGTLIPGAAPLPSRYETQGFQAARNGFSINGSRTQSNNFLLDGVSNNDPHLNGFVFTPPPDALDQFKIITSSYSAEYGNNAGSVVNAITKPGTNQLHGSLWNFLRNDALDARNFFSVSKPPLRQNQFGAAMGGPLKRDRTFLFGYYEGVRARTGRVQNVVVLTDAQRQGNLSGLNPPPVDPRAGNQPFPGAVIPQSRFSPVASRLVETFVPRVNFGANRFIRSPSVAGAGNQGALRGDHRLSDRSLLFGRYSHQRLEERNPLGAGTFSPGGSASEEYNHSAVVSHTYTISANTLNEASVSYLRTFGRPSTWSGEDLSTYGWRYPATEPTAKGLPISAITGLFSIGDVAQSYTQLARNTYQVFDNFSYIRGRHTIKTGGEYRMQQLYLVFPNRPNGDFSFTGAVSRNAVADFLLGQPAQFRQGGGQPAKHFVGHTAGLYLQDDWKVTRRLTLNLGLRYELPFPYFDKQDRVASFQPGRQSRVRPTAPANLLFPGDDGVSRGTIATDTNNFAPRFGFAYDLAGNGQTSLRGGYGIFYDAVPGVAVFQNINVPPFNRFVQIDIPPAFDNPYSGFAVNPQTDPSRDFPCPCLVIGFSPDFRTPYVQQMHLTVQRQLQRDLVFEIGYTGSLGRKLGGYLEVNPAVPGPGATRANTQQRRLYPEYNLVRPTFSHFNSAYHGLQTRLERRYSNGLQFLVSYTWSKAIDYQSSINFGGENRPQDAFSMRDIRGLAAFDLRHRFVSTYGYQLPFGKGRLMGGWKLMGIVSAQSGSPLTAREAVDLSLRGLGADRPDQIANPNDGPKTPQRWFDTGAFARLADVAGGQRSGTAGRNTIIGPGLVQTDLSLLKTFTIREGHGLEFRAEFFNAFNKANFRDPDTNISQPATFGVINAARPARIIQLALKYQF
ncbi:MAG: TonB-dependent receptor [Bryobacteraceae bacterium]|nr:TonB-dependent receptor [Bryobacteraceae bacterium]